MPPTQEPKPLKNAIPPMLSTRWAHSLSQYNATASRFAEVIYCFKNMATTFLWQAALGMTKKDYKEACIKKTLADGTHVLLFQTPPNHVTISKHASSRWVESAQFQEGRLKCKARFKLWQPTSNCMYKSKEPLVQVFACKRFHYNTCELEVAT